jgi:3-oxoacyl-[acyl-carrier protein] reductase
MSKTSLQNRSAVVTGATRGIGFSIARELVAAGTSVAINGRSKASVDDAVGKLSKISSGARVVGRAADVADAKQVSDFFQFVDGELGNIDILVNNAGLGIFRSTAEMSLDEWRQVIDTNLSGVFYCSHEALPRMKKKGEGYIINISSLAGKNPFGGGAAYNASKFGLNGFSEAMMLDHRYDGVRVSYIMPGSVDTEFNSSATGAEWKIAADDIADIVMMLLAMPARTLVSRVEVRPAKPKK